MSCGHWIKFTYKLCLSKSKKKFIFLLYSYWGIYYTDFLGLLT